MESTRTCGGVQSTPRSLGRLSVEIDWLEGSGLTVSTMESGEYNFNSNSLVSSSSLHDF
jgi:hypothetical protein